ncbi:DUF885 domain-containing protein [Corynebacterium alimapuense]|uniref:DUF885 domain-containing protein n=1 Tax=Corynebacterium alimapuense TaxID=1576874 RepID=A0A3M8K515_9CORY|nr:DUF885 domain-containing protein [Corynebacterium alimapuense]RNE48190.1 DUF885 domain-containing protein [Corynebacterium alimapuense]
MSSEKIVDHQTPRSEERAPSLLDASCEGFVYDLAALSPTDATAWGINGYEGDLQDFSPEYWSARADRTREMIADVDAFDDGTDECDDDDDFDEVDHVTAAVLRDRLCLDLDLHYHGEDLALLNNIASPVQTIRDTLVLMPNETVEQIDAIRSRLSQVKKSLEGYQESLAEAAAHGHVAPSRQIDDVTSQCGDLADSGSLLESLGVDPHSAEVASAKHAFADLADWLSEQLVTHAPHEDAVGRDRYRRFSHLFVGDTVDLDEAYTWGLERLREITDEQKRIAAKLYGSKTSVTRAFRHLNAEERYTLNGTDELVEWMQRTADQAVTDLSATAFDIPEQVRTIECRIDPAGTGGIFYTPPSDDFSRPGRMWWSVPPTQKTFHTWQELTTVFHEGVPGHHLQIGQTLVERDKLNLWRRVACWNSGHGEGWALYAEQLMEELGYHEDLGTRMGLLDAQRLRAARVVLDIGVHLRKKAPEGANVWDASYAKAFLRDNSAMDEANLRFELNRYLGWPGQAPSYALGQRLWQQTRDDAVAQGQSVRDFHREALSLGSIPMSILREQILN